MYAYTHTRTHTHTGCLPILIQFPVFVGLYRTLLNLGRDKVLVLKYLYVHRYIDMHTPTQSLSLSLSSLSLSVHTCIHSYIYTSIHPYRTLLNL